MVGGGKEAIKTKKLNFLKHFYSFDLKQDQILSTCNLHFGVQASDPAFIWVQLSLLCPKKTANQVLISVRISV